MAFDWVFLFNESVRRYLKLKVKEKLMNRTCLRWLLLLITVFSVSACSSGGGSDSAIADAADEVDDVSENIETPDAPIDQTNGEGDISEEIETPDAPIDQLAIGLDTNSLATEGCQNVVIIDGYAYAACGNGIEIVDLDSFERNFIALPADDITGDAELAILFTQSRDTLQQLDLADPMAPSPIATVETNFSIFSGVSAANGILVVSAGASGSNTEVYAYDATTLSLVVNGIPLVDSRTGNPDVHVASTANGALAFYSEDIGAVANWGIQIVEFDTNGNILELPELVVLTPGPFTGSFGVPFGPANLPVESEFLNDRLYIAHFAASGIEVIDRANSDALSLIPLGYEPTNIATDGSDLFVVGVELSTVDTIDPISEAVVDTISLPLQQPVGIAASATHIAVADRSAGLIVTTR